MGGGLRQLANQSCYCCPYFHEGVLWSSRVKLCSRCGCKPGQKSGLSVRDSLSIQLLSIEDTPLPVDQFISEVHQGGNNDRTTSKDPIYLREFLPCRHVFQSKQALIRHIYRGRLRQLEKRRVCSFSRSAVHLWQVCRPFWECRGYRIGVWISPRPTAEVRTDSGSSKAQDKEQNVQRRRVSKLHSALLYLWRSG